MTSPRHSPITLGVFKAELAKIDSKFDDLEIEVVESMLGFHLSPVLNHSSWPNKKLTLSIDPKRCHFITLMPNPQFTALKQIEVAPVTNSNEYIEPLTPIFLEGDGPE